MFAPGVQAVVSDSVFSFLLNSVGAVVSVVLEFVMKSRWTPCSLSGFAAEAA